MMDSRNVLDAAARVRAAYIEANAARAERAERSLAPVTNLVASGDVKLTVHRDLLARRLRTLTAGERPPA
jgi:hypothetical protein